MDTSSLVGHLAAWNYFQSIDAPQNKTFVKAFKAYCEKNSLPGGAKRVTDDPMEAAYIGVNIWRQAVEQAGTTNVDAVRQAIAGQYFLAPGGWVQMDEKNHHLKKPVIIGEILADGQFQEVWRTKGLVRAEPWSKFVKDSKEKIADWTWPNITGNETKAKFEVPAHP
jgi:urea transport system substrate-binding protein